MRGHEDRLDVPRGAPTDGIWATGALAKEDLIVALERNELDVDVVDAWRDEWDEIDHWMFEFAIGDGQWWQDELADGVIVSGWVGDFVTVDENTLELSDVECKITYDVDLSGDTLAIDVAKSDRPSDDLALQTAMVEAAPFRLVQAADWMPEDLSPNPGC
jgi:hypothetical protein